MRQGRVALLASLALLSLAVAFTLTRAPLRVVRVSAKPEEVLGSTTGTPTVCQTGEVLPGGITAIRLGLEASFGPRVLVHAYSPTRLLTSGSHTSNWTSASVTVPVTPLKQATSNVKLCFSVPVNSEFLQLYGVPTGPRRAAVGGNGERFPGRISIEYLTPAGGSWWSRAQLVARHMGLGRAFSGTWVALLVAILAAAVAALLTSLAWRDLP